MDPAVSRLAQLGLCMSLLLGPPTGAAAHAIVVQSKPAPNATVGPDVAIDLRFNSRIDRKRSRLVIVDPGGHEAPLGLAADEAPDRLRARASGLAPGKYRIDWYVLSPDGHITRGNIPFVVDRSKAAQ